MKKYLLPFAILIMIACEHEKKYDIASIISIPNCNYGSQAEISSIYNADIVTLQTDNNCLIGKIDKVIILDSLILIMDSKISKKLFVFDLSGNYIRNIGNYGKGYGEYLYLTDFDVHNNNIYLISGVDKKLISFDINGKIINEFRTENFLGTHFKIIDDKTLVTTRSNSILTANIWNLNKKKKTIEHQKTINNVKNTNFQWMTLKDLSFCKDTLFICRSFQDTIFKLDNNKLYPRYALNYKNPFPLKQDVTSKEIRKLKRLNKYTTMTKFFISKNLILLCLDYKGNMVYNLTNRIKGLSQTFHIIRYKNIQLTRPVGEIEDGIVFCSSAELIHNHFSTSTPYIDSTFSKKLLKVEYTDNPVIFVLREKLFENEK